MNPIQGWLKIIGTVENARKLRKLLTRIDQPKYVNNMILGQDGLPTLYLTQREPSMCPSRLLYGQKKSEQMYLNPELRPALDAWDNGEISEQYLVKLTYEIDKERLNPGTRRGHAQKR